MRRLLSWNDIDNMKILKADYLNMICNTVVTRDMIEHYGIRNEELFSAVINLLCSSIGSYVLASNIANTLKNNVFKTVDNESISRYLGYTCDTFQHSAI
jgi:predicted AAA+ superfamily ATPase